MWQGIAVAVVVGLAAWFVGRRLLRTLRPKAGAPSCGCGCGGGGPCHQTLPLSGPTPPECASCEQGPPQAKG